MTGFMLGACGFVYLVEYEVQERKSNIYEKSGKSNQYMMLGGYLYVERYG